MPEFTDGALQLALRHPSDTIKMLAADLIAKNAEVQASRKLVADLRAVHGTMKCCQSRPCATVQIIHQAGL